VTAPAHAFYVGATVEVLAERRGVATWKDGAWRREVVDVWKLAIVERLAPYLGRPGYYVSYPEARQMWECHGGWMPGHLVRERKH
jgi:hypothetical protein